MLESGSTRTGAEWRFSLQLRSLRWASWKTVLSGFPEREKFRENEYPREPTCFLVSGDPPPHISAFEYSEIQLWCLMNNVNKELPTVRVYGHGGFQYERSVVEQSTIAHTPRPKNSPLFFLLLFVWFSSTIHCLSQTVLPASEHSSVAVASLTSSRNILPFYNADYASRFYALGFSLASLLEGAA
jgi:hypothetical protein